MIAADFECACGNIFERFVTTHETPYPWLEERYQQCPQCDRMAKRIISFRGGFRADPVWLDSACTLLQTDDPAEKPIESRSEFNRYLKKHDIIQRC